MKNEVQSSAASGKIIVAAFACLAIWAVTALCDMALGFRGIHLPVLPVVTRIAGWSVLPLLLFAVLLRLSQEKPRGN